MKWGIVTDTHDQGKLVKKAVTVFEEQGCDCVFHCGDFCKDSIADSFVDRKFKFYYVTDHSSHDKEMKKYRNDKLDERISNKRIFSFHDTYSCKTSESFKNVHVLQEAICSYLYDYVFYGHLHYFNLKLSSSINNTIVINAGGFYYDNLSTFCILDINSAWLEVYYWIDGDFFPILRFKLANKGFGNMVILDDIRAFYYAEALSRRRRLNSDKFEYAHSTEEDERWFCKNYKILFDKIGYKEEPSFYVL